MDLEYNDSRLMAGDCLGRLKEIETGSIDLIVTDPPYDIKSTKPGGNSRLARSIRPMNNELKKQGLTVGFDMAILDEMVRVCKNINIYIFCNKAQLPMYFKYFVLSKLKCNFDLIKWVKTNAMPTYNNKYLSDTEYCFYARKGAYCNPENYKDASTLHHAPMNVKDKKIYNHPTIKPIELVEKLIRNSSKPGDIILDPFMGSGTTGVAAINTGRKFIGIEKDATYYGVSCGRIMQSYLDGLNINA